MSEDDDKKRPDPINVSGKPGNERPSGEDPLIELARIVHNNKQVGAPVSSGRVGNTDYFAGLDDFASEPQSDVSDAQPRTEPDFGSPREALSAVEPQAVPGQRLDSEIGGQQVSASSSSWPDVPRLDTIEKTAPQAVTRPAVNAFGGQPTPVIEPHAFAHEAENAGVTNLAPSVAIDLEQNLTAELEDELKGALRHTDDQPADTDIAPAEPVTQPVGQFHISGLQTPVAGYNQSISANNDARFEQPQTNTDSGDRYADFGRPRPVDPEPQVTSDFDPAPHLAPREPAAAPAQSRPAINEDDLFAALTTPPAAASATEAAPADKDAKPAIAGIDTLLADLDFPEREQRHQSASDHLQEPLGSEPSQQLPASRPDTTSAPAADDIDDMAWPAAADAVPDVRDEDTPPPPEGYDLDAVARAMQESDPTLKGSGVLPPHSAAEQAAVPHAEERSRRGLFVAGGVLAVAAIGSAGFFFMDSGGITVPDGPPPVISGLQEPLKIFPEAQDTSVGNNQSAKLIYDRVDGTSENAPTQLAPQETPEPASLPPAPAGVQSGADLVPGATKRVRTVVVRPDGTIVSGEDAAPAPTPAQPAPAAPSEPRAVTTQPIIANPEPAPAEPAVAPQLATPAIATPAAPAPATPAPETPAIVAGTEPVAAEPEPAAPAAVIPSVLPRKKPAAPVRVAQAPAAVVNPVPAATKNNGPLNLSQPAPTPVATTPATGGTATGSIPSGTNIVQVTSQRSASAARDAYSGLQRRFPSILGNRNAVIVPADLGDRGTFYRARIPTGSREEAVRLCEQLQGAGGDCFVRRMP